MRPYRNSQTEAKTFGPLRQYRNSYRSTLGIIGLLFDFDRAAGWRLEPDLRFSVIVEINILIIIQHAPTGKVAQTPIPACLTAVHLTASLKAMRSQLDLRTDAHTVRRVHVDELLVAQLTPQRGIEQRQLQLIGHV